MIGSRTGERGKPLTSVPPCDHEQLALAPASDSDQVFHVRNLGANYIRRTARTAATRWPARPRVKQWTNDIIDRKKTMEPASRGSKTYVRPRYCNALDLLISIIFSFLSL
jgi:hypothetical protein